MLLLASCVATLTLVSSGGCITTTPIEFEAAENYPPSVVSEPTAEFPLNQIGRLDLDVPVDSPEMPLEVVVRDPNLDQTLAYRMYLDSPPAPDIPFTSGEITPSGFVERPTVFFVPYDRLAAGECHRIELIVTGGFANFVTRRPAEEGDFDDATWWVEVVDTDFPVITEDCR
jgi:hypothetical protein